MVGLMKIKLRKLDSKRRTATDSDEVQSFAAAEMVLHSWRVNGHCSVSAEILVEPGLMVTTQYSMNPENLRDLRETVVREHEERLQTLQRDRAHPRDIQRVQKALAILRVSQ